MTLRWAIISKNRTNANRVSGWVKRRLPESFDILKSYILLINGWGRKFVENVRRVCDIPIGAVAMDG